MAKNKQKTDKDIAREKAKQIEKMMEDKDTSPIIKWVYSNRLILTIIIAVILIAGISIAVVFGVRKTYAQNISKEYLSAYNQIRELEDKNAILNLSQNEKSELKTELLKVIEKGKNTAFKTYEYRLANYYMGIIEFSDGNFEGSSGSIHYFTVAYKGDSSYPFKDYAYFNVGKSYEQQGYAYQTDGSIEKAKEIYSKAINHYIKMEKKFKNSFLPLRAKYQAGILYETLAELSEDKEEKLKHYTEAETIYEEIQNTPEYETGKTTAFIDNKNTDIAPDTRKETKEFIDSVDNALVRIALVKTKIKNDEDITTPKMSSSSSEDDNTTEEEEDGTSENND